MKLEIRNNAGVKLTLPVDENATHNISIHGDDVLSLSVVHHESKPIEPGDHIVYDGVTYVAKERYVPKLISHMEWHYNLQFHGPQSQLGGVLILNTEGSPVFVLTATPREQLALIVSNLNRHHGGNRFVVGECVSGGALIMDYTSGMYAGDALGQLAKLAKTEWWIDGNKINLTKCIRGEELVLGYKSGLHSIERDVADNVKFFTRLFPIGSERNIDQLKYGAPRLQLPGGAKYVERHAELGLVEHFEREAFKDIYPRREGVISEVRHRTAKGKDGKSFEIYHFKDKDIPFDPNTYEIAGLVKQVTFQSGQLAGREFEVNYDSSTKEFEIITQFPYEDQEDLQLPGGALIPIIGDKYVLWNIRMPDEYYGLAEAEFAQKVAEYIDEHAVDHSTYKCHTDYIYLQERGIRLRIGQRVKIVSDVLFPDTGYRVSRITAISRKIGRPTDAHIEISDVISKTSKAAMNESIEEVKGETKAIKRKSVAEEERNARQVKETREMIDRAFAHIGSGLKASTVTAMQIIAGDMSTHFRFVRSRTDDRAPAYPLSYNVDNATLSLVPTVVQHQTLGIKGITKRHKPSEYRYWDVDAYTSESLILDEAYYIYLKCPKVGNKATVVLSKEPIAPEASADHYHLMVGILSSAEPDRRRSYARLHGFSEILPGQIQTGVIRSEDGRDYIDFEQKKYRLTWDGGYLDINSLGDGKARLKGALITVGDNDTTIEDYLEGNKGVSFTAIVRPQGTWRNDKMRDLQFYVNVRNIDGSSVGNYQLRWRHLFSTESGGGNWTEWQSSSSYVYRFGNRDNASARLEVEAEITHNGQKIIATCAVSNVKDGRNGKDGRDGQDGRDGRDGQNGDDGRGVDSVVKEWAKTSDPDKPPTQGSPLWSSIPPKPEAGKYIWERTKTVMTDNNVYYTTPVRVELTGVSKALAEAFETSTEIKGGLIATTMLLVRNAANKIRAYFSGAGSKSNDIAFAAGVENFGLENETQETYIKQNGDAKFGDLYIDAKGQAYAMREGKRYLIVGGQIPTLTQLLAGQGDDIMGQGRESRTFVSENKIYYADISESVTVKNANATISVQGRISADRDVDMENSFGESSPIWLKIGLYKGGTLVHEVARTSVKNYAEVVSLDYKVPTPGTYRLRCLMDFTEKVSYSVGFVKCKFSGNIHGMFQGSGSYAHFGGGGMAISQGVDNFLLFDKNGLQLGPKTKMPGILAAGRVDFRGRVQAYWGALVNRQYDTAPYVDKRSTGVYVVYHSIPHTKYIPTVTCMDEDGVGAYVSNSEILPYQFTVRFFGTNSQNPYDSGFTYQLIGAP